MSETPYEIPEEVPDEDKQVLRSKKDVFTKACLYRPLRWIPREDEHGRPIYHLVGYSEPDNLYFEGTIEDIERKSDQEINAEIILSGGDDTVSTSE